MQLQGQEYRTSAWDEQGRKGQKKPEGADPAESDGKGTDTLPGWRRGCHVAALQHRTARQAMHVKVVQTESS